MLKKIFLPLWIILASSQANAGNQCMVEQSWEKMVNFRRSLLEKQSFDIERESNNLSLLPTMSISTTQNINKRSKVGSFTDTSLGLSVSQSLYTAGTYFKSAKIIDIKSESNSIQSEIDRISYLTSIFDIVSDIRYRQERLKVYEEQVQLLSSQLKKYEYEYSYGNISKVELDIFLGQKSKNEDQVETEINEISRAREKLREEYYIDSEQLQFITASSIVACKNNGLQELVKENSVKEREVLNLNFDKNVTSSLSPSVGVFVNATPKNDGMISSANDGFEHSAGLSVSVPLSNAFIYGNQKKQLALDLSRSFLSEDNELLRIMTEKNDLKSELSNLERKVVVYKSILEMEKKKVDYAYFRYNNKSGSLIEYQNEMNSYNQSVLDFKLMENNLEATAFAFLFISGIFSPVFGAPYYGVLDGSSILTFSVPVSGVVFFSLDDAQKSAIQNNKKIYEIKSNESVGKKSIALLKQKELRSKSARLNSQLDMLKGGVREGFVSENDVYVKLDELHENEMNIKLTERELSELSFLEEQSNPVISGRFILRETFVSNGQFVKAGDKIVQVSTLDKLIIKIKVDPVVSSEYSSGKDVKYRSLVDNNVQGIGRVTSVASEW
ncbi:TolC family protein [Yersinia ruckeri]